MGRRSRSTSDTQFRWQLCALTFDKQHHRPVSMGVHIDIPVGSPFTIHNIPFGVISTEEEPAPRCATAIGNYAMDLVAYSAGGRLKEVDPNVFFQELFSLVSYALCHGFLDLTLTKQPTLNTFAALPQNVRQQVRQKIIEDIQNSNVDNECLIPLWKVTMHLPMRIGGFSDFYCSLEHCQNVSSAPLAGRRPGILTSIRALHTCLPELRYRVTGSMPHRSTILVYQALLHRHSQCVAHGESITRMATSLYMAHQIEWTTS